MSYTPHRPSLSAIAFAEGGSTVVSLGSIAVMEAMPKTMEPLYTWAAHHIIYPHLAKAHPPKTPQEEAGLRAYAHRRASLFVKAGAMIGTGFVAHIPMQLAMEKRLHAEGFRDAFVGKGTGLAVSLGSILVLNRVAPGAIPAMQKALAPIIAPFIPDAPDTKRDEARVRQIANLLILDMPSSVISGLANYFMSHRVR